MVEVEIKLRRPLLTRIIETFTDDVTLGEATRDKVVIYLDAHAQTCDSEEELIKEIIDTIVHETIHAILTRYGIYDDEVVTRVLTRLSV